MIFELMKEKYEGQSKINVLIHWTMDFNASGGVLTLKHFHNLSNRLNVSICIWTPKTEYILLGMIKSDKQIMKHHHSMICSFHINWRNDYDYKFRWIKNENYLYTFYDKNQFNRMREPSSDARTTLSKIQSLNEWQNISISLFFKFDHYQVNGACSFNWYYFYGS